MTVRRCWWLCFAYAAGVAALVQLVLLPYVVPAWHADNGLLRGGDWVSFHRIAVELAQQIRLDGWTAWELRPDGQAPAGIAAAIYALTVPQPWTVIPFNAALHATGTVVLLQIARLFVPDWRPAAGAALPFLLYPSAMTWYTQLHKDGLSIAGALLILYGLIRLVQLEGWLDGRRQPLWAALSVLLGTVLIWVVRPYQVEVVLGISSGLGFVYTGVFLARGLSGRLSWFRVLSAVVIFWVLLVSMAPFTRDLLPVHYRTPAATPPPTVEPVNWTAVSYLPAMVDARLRGLAENRHRFLAFYPDAASTLDRQVTLQNAPAVVGYLPRAMQVALFAPFPNQWFGQGSMESNTWFRRVAALEMLGVYAALAMLPVVVWRWRRRLELWFALVSCVGIMTVQSLAIPNAGSLYRARYGYIMVLVAFGALGWFSVLSQRFKNPVHRQANS